MGVGGEGTGPGDVAMADGVKSVAAFVEDPAGAGVNFAQSEIIGGDVRFAFGKAFFGNGELVHEGTAEVMFFGSEIHFKEAAVELGSGFPADLATETRFVAGGQHAGNLAEEIKEYGLEEVPIFGAGGEKGPKPEGGVFVLVDVEGGEVTLAGGSDIEPQTILRATG